MNVSTSIFDEVAAGIWDDGLEALAEAVRARREYLKDQRGARNQMEFQHGTRVRLVDIRPRYLAGVEGLVNKQKMPNRRGDLMIDIDPRHYSRLGRYGRTLGVPASSLEEVK